MNLRRCAGALAGVLLAIAASAPLAHAQIVMNEGTRVTFREAIQIPGQILEPGTYLFERANDGNAPNLNLIRIYNYDHTQLVATIETATAERRVMTGQTLMTFAERSDGTPPALVAWFYPGMREGHAFLYSPRTESTLEASKLDFVESNGSRAKRVADDSGD